MTAPFALDRNPHPRTDAEREEILRAPGFGRYFTDHMVVIEYADGTWQQPRICPYGPLRLDPATMVLHYGQEVFEGLKAYRQPDGTVAAFRPEANAARFARSARRLGMAALPEDLFVESLRALVALDSAWVPSDPDKSLYLRPFMIASEVGLGVRPSAAYTYFVIASPAASYFAGGVAPVTVWLSTEHTRAAPGGTGEVKCGGNYAASILAQAEAAKRGCDQVVWLDALEHRWVEEMGTNNLYFVYGSGPKARVMTPALTGTLLPGVTRDALLTLAADLGYSVDEGKISTDEWQQGCASGAISEVFGCGTAAVVTPVGTVHSAHASWTVGDGTAGPVATQLRERLTGIQTGREPDTHGWLHRLL
jgi:branched-chain amino acid aminotransferase